MCSGVTPGKSTQRGKKAEKKVRGRDLQEEQEDKKALVLSGIMYTCTSACRRGQVSQQMARFILLMCSLRCGERGTLSSDCVREQVQKRMWQMCQPPGVCLGHSSLWEEDNSDWDCVIDWAIQLNQIRAALQAHLLSLEVFLSQTI